MKIKLCKIYLALLLFAVCCMTYYSSFPQQYNKDSIKKVLDAHEKNDSEKIKLLYNYALSLPDTAFSLSIQYFQQGIALARNLNNKTELARGLFFVGDRYARENRSDSSIYFLLQALTIAEQSNFKTTSIYLDLGEAYRGINDIKHEYYVSKALQAAKADKDSATILGAYTSFIAMADEKKQWSKLDKLALEALPLAKELHNAFAFAYILEAQAEEYISLQEHDKAIDNCRTALTIWKDMNVPHFIAYTETTISVAFTESNVRDSALWYAKAALATAERYHMDKEIGDAHEALFKYYNHFGDYKNALKERLAFDSIQEAQSLEQQAQTVTRAETSYNQEKKDLLASIEKQKQDAIERNKRNIQYGIITVIVLLTLFLLYNNRQKQKAKTKIEKAYTELKSTQAQLIQSEKMASLGELTAGIAHEIQNPLNFVNNFSDVSNELLDELKTELAAGNGQEATAIADDVKQNLEKIIHHGKRADAIVKGMLQHSRVSTGQKEPADINALADEYLRLSYHGMRAKDKSFNVTLQTDFDASIAKINVVPQDMGRVLLNLFNNAFYSVMEKRKRVSDGYEPTVSVSTKRLDNRVEIHVKDNGIGIPPKEVDKIFQPFFTTKPTGQGTGLGLSLSYDIVKAHGGEIKAESKEGEGVEFIIRLH